MNIPTRKYKIALVAYSLSKGGLERVMSNLSLYFASVGIEVHNIVLTDDVEYPYGGTLINFGKEKANRSSILGSLTQFANLRKYLNQQQFDYVIDFRYRLNSISELVMARWVYPVKTVYTIHSGNLSTYIPKNKIFAKLIYNSKYATVCVSDAILEKVKSEYGFKNLIRIYNSVTVGVADDEHIAMNFKYVIGIGRFDTTNVKQLDKLIETYLDSELPEKDIHLLLLGDGERKSEVQQRFNTSDKIHFLGFKNNPKAYLKNALFLVLSSKNEGFPMAVIEALSVGTPVVSFDCFSGPNEIIRHGFNGLLVQDQNFEQLKESMNLMMSDSVLYVNCKQNAEKSVLQFRIEKVGPQWLDLLKIELAS